MAGSGLGELATLVGGQIVAPAGPLPTVVDVTHDSRQAGPGMLFVAVRGAASDGHDFVSHSMEAGAAAVCVEHAMGVAIPQLVVPDTRQVMGPLAARVHGDPSHQMTVVGVTGTNGKTTVTHYIESMGAGSGLHTGLIGTIETRMGSHTFDSVRTTPEATDFQRLLATMRDGGCRLVATEVSSHALALGRVRATRFEVAAFTNLSRDHLDFHRDMESYWLAKAALFREYEVGTAVINIDDPAGRRIVDDLARGEGGPRVIRVGIGGDAWAEGIEPTAGGTSFRLSTPWGSAGVDTPVMGGFNVDNAVLAAVCCLAAGISFDSVAEGLTRLAGVPGRFEKVSGADPVMVIVDYAHTPAGIVHAIEAARGLGRGRVVVLVGAGGDRDREKRPLMGWAASAADLAVITSDNPRSEDPASIVAEVADGVDPGADLIVEVDRRRAIRTSLRSAKEGDVVLVLGRGHERFQEIADGRIPFDDRSVVREELATLRSSTNSGPAEGSMVS
jgi:UDP-N-acetylmuramoyl-L-alanyl-D-glutamate--2,6-diaminopimelate ligase